MLPVTARKNFHRNQSPGKTSTRGQSSGEIPTGGNNPPNSNPTVQSAPVPVMFQPVARSLFSISCSPIKGRRQSSRKVTKERDSLHRGYIARSLQGTGTDDRKRHIPLPARPLPGERNDKFKNCFNKKRMTEQRKAISENVQAAYLSLPAHRRPGHRTHKNRTKTGRRRPGRPEVFSFSRKNKSSRKELFHFTASTAKNTA